MVDQLTPKPAGAEIWRPAQVKPPTRLSGEHVVDRVAGVSGVTRVKLDAISFLDRPTPVVEAGSGIGQPGSRIGEPAPLGASSFSPVPVFEAPLGEQRI